MAGLKFRVASGREDFEAVRSLCGRRYGRHGPHGTGLSRTARARLASLIRTGSLVVASDGPSSQLIGAVPLDFVSFDNALLVPFNLAPDDDRGRVLRLQLQLVLQATIHSGVGRLLFCADETEGYQRAIGEFNTRLAEQRLPVSFEILGTVENYFEKNSNVSMSSLFIRRAERPDLTRQVPATVNAIIRTAFEVSRSSLLINGDADTIAKDELKDIVEKANTDKQSEKPHDKDIDKGDQDKLSDKSDQDTVKMSKDVDKEIDKLDKEGDDKGDSDKGLLDKIETEKFKDTSDKGEGDKDKEATEKGDEDKDKEGSDKDKEASDKDDDKDSDKDDGDKDKEGSDKDDGEKLSFEEKDKEGSDKEDGDTEPDTRRPSGRRLEADLIGTRQAVIYRRLKVALPESAERSDEV